MSGGENLQSMIAASLVPAAVGALLPAPVDPSAAPLFGGTLSCSAARIVRTLFGCRPDVHSRHPAPQENSDDA